MTAPSLAQDFSEAIHFSDSTWATNAFSLGDIDADGDLDVVFGNSTGNGGNFAYLNEGGIFSRAPWWPSDRDLTTYSLALGDLDNDGDLDLACGNRFFSNEVYFNAQGALGSAFDWQTGENLYTRGILLADLNADGYLDLVTANRGAADHVYFGSDTGMNTSPGWTSPQITNSLCVACGDVNGDGWLDLVFGNEVQSNTLYLGSAAGFTQSVPDWSSSAQRSTMALDLGDVDGDGHLDLVCGNSQGIEESGNTLYLNSSGLFEPDPVQLTPEQEQTLGLALGDVDLDGDLDLILGNRDAPSTLYLNDGSGSYGTVPAWSDNTDSPTNAVAFGDLNGDGMLDLVFANDGGNNTYFLNRNGPLDRGPVWEADTPLTTVSLALGDIDLDGDLDLVSGSGSLLQANGLYLNTGGSFAQVSNWNPPADVTTFVVRLGDVDNDGRIDVVCGNYDSPNTLHLNTGGMFGPDVWNLGVIRVTNDLALGDIDGDGDLDLVCGHGSVVDAEPNALYLNNGSGFDQTPVWESGLANSTEAVVLGDVDGDGDLDLVCGNTADAVGQVNTLYLNLGGTFETMPSWQSQEANKTRSLVLGDVDGDGDLDLVCGNGGNPDQVTTLYYNQGGVLETTPSWRTEDAGIATAVLLRDLDADGDLDLVRALFDDGPNRVHLNVSGHLNESADWVSNESRTTGALALGDVDGDNDLDLVCGNRSEGNTLYLGHYGSAWLADPQAVTHQPTEHPAYVQDVNLVWQSTNTYQVNLAAVDVESDPLYLVGEYQLAGDPTWYPADLSLSGQGPGPLTTSPQGESHQLVWNVFLAPIDQRQIILRLRSYATAGQVSAYSAIPSYLCDPLKLQVNRPQITVLAAGLDFPTLTVGDLDSLSFDVRNTGTETLFLTDADLPGTEMRLTPALPLTLAAEAVISLTLHLEPRLQIDMNGTMQLLSNDPLLPMAPVPVATDILALDFVSRLLTQEADIPLGEAVTVIVTPDHQVNVAGGFLYHRPVGTGNAFTDSLVLVPDSGDFIAIVPGSGVTETGLEYYVRVENNGVYATDPSTAPAVVNFQAVQIPSQVTLYPLASSSSGFLTGRDVRVEAQLDPGAEFVSGELYYRRGGEQDYRLAEFARGDSRPVALIPDTLVDASGLEYWCRIQTLTTELVDPPWAAADQPRLLPVTVPELIAPEAVDGGRYHMVSIPLDFGADFTGTLESMLYVQDAYGSYDPTRWRSFRYLPDLGRNVELSANPEAFRLQPGRAFWLVCRQSEAVSTAPLEGYSPSTAVPWSITLEPGWNQVGHPFTFPVAWDSVTVDGATASEALNTMVIEAPVRWDWPEQAYMRDVTGLEGFSGYWIHNLTDMDVILAIPPVRMVETAKRAPSVTALNWQIGITARCDKVHSTRATAGISPDAEVQRDPLDLGKAPAQPGPELAVLFPHAKWDKGGGPILRDVRPANIAQAGWYWDLAIAKNFALDGVADEVVLSVTGLADVPSHLDVVLYDRLTRQTRDLRPEGTFSLHLGHSPYTSEAAKARFRLLVGTASFVQDNLASKDLPTVTALLQNRPNPFNPATLLRFDLERPSMVHLTVHDLRGRVVTELLAERLEGGRQEVLWRGGDRTGRQVAAGVYFYRLRTDFGFNATGKMTLVR